MSSGRRRCRCNFLAGRDGLGGVVGIGCFQRSNTSGERFESSALRSTSSAVGSTTLAPPPGCPWQNDVMSRVALEVVEGFAVDATRLADGCERYGIAELAVFGSVVRGVAIPTSDVDLLYVMAPECALGFAINRLEDELAEVFGRRVDLVAKRAVHRMLRDNVLAEARTLYAA